MSIRRIRIYIVIIALLVLALFFLGAKPKQVPSVQFALPTQEVQLFYHHDQDTTQVHVQVVTVIGRVYPDSVIVKMGSNSVTYRR